MKVSVFIERPLVCIDTEKLRVYITNGPWRRVCDNPYDSYAYDPSIPEDLEMFLAMAEEYGLTEEAQEALRIIGFKSE